MDQPEAILLDAERAIKLHARPDKGRFGEDGLDIDTAVKIIAILRDELVKALGHGEIVSHHPDGPDQVVPPFVRDWLYPPGDARRSPQDRCSICGVKMPCDAQDHDVDAHLDAGPALDDWDGMPNR